MMTGVPWIAVVVLGCGSSPTPAIPQPVTPDAAPVVTIDAPLPLDQDLPRLAARAVALYEDVNAAFAAAGEDCAVAAGRLGELAASYRDVVAANAKVEREGRGMELKLALRHLEDRFEAAAKSIIQSPTLASCVQDPAFVKAYDDLFGAKP